MKILPISEIRKKSPLIHCITNYVTANDCANMLIASGAAPTMADAKDEVEEIASIASAVCLNIGTISPSLVSAMIKAAKKANDLGKPVILDPVGAGASRLRIDTVDKILSSTKISVIRGNISEIKTVANGSGFTKGVDADESDVVTNDSLAATARLARGLSARTGAVVSISGAIDIISDAKRTFAIRNGNELMSKVSGTGCMLSTVTAAFVALDKEHPLEATASAFIAMGVCGELAAASSVDIGYSSFRTALIDAMCRLTDSTMSQMAKIEEVIL